MSHDYTQDSIRELIDKLETALEEIDATLESLGSLPVHRRTETRLHIVADNIESVQQQLQGGH